MLLCLHQSPEADLAWHELTSAVAVLSFRVASRDALELWHKRLTELGAKHSSPRQVHLGWALDVVDPNGFRIQLHTREAISGSSKLAGTLSRSRDVG